MSNDPPEANSRAIIVGFAAVGGAGFVVDASILTILSQVLGVNIYESRVISFSAATLATWFLNRTFVFQRQALSPRSRSAEYVRYLLVQTGGALLNLAVFSVLIEWIPPLRFYPVVPLAAGAAVGLVFNFTGSRYWVFARDKVTSI